MAIGATMRGEGQYEPAFVYSHLADYLAPNDARVIFQIAELLDAQKMWVEAAVWYNQIERGDPLFIEAQIHRAHALDDLGLHEKAIGGLSDVLEADGEARDVLVAMGDLLRMNERFAEAESAYDRAIATIGEEQKPFWHIYFARGICHERLGDWERAEIDLQKARELSDGEPHVLNYLGYSWIDQGIYLREGLKIIQQAVKKKPSNGAFRDSLGWAYYRLGKYNEALSQLEYASRLEPLDPIITDHLGDVLWQLGRKVEARYQWSKALAFEPEEKDRVKIEAKLITGLKSKSSKGSRPVKIPRGGTAI